MSTNPSDANPVDFDSMDLSKIQETLQNIDFGQGKKAEESVKELLEIALKKGIMPKTALQLKDDTMEAIYTQAYNLYNQGKYKEASYIFRLLMLLDFSTPKYVLGFAACAHRMKDYTNAANLYLLCAAMDPKNPLPHFHSTDCYLQLKAPMIALLSLRMTIAICGDQSKYQVIKERASLMKSTLEEQLKTELTAKNEAPKEEPAKSE